MTIVIVKGKYEQGFRSVDIYLVRYLGFMALIRGKFEFCTLFKLGIDL